MHFHCIVISNFVKALLSQLATNLWKLWAVVLIEYKSSFRQDLALRSELPFHFKRSTSAFCKPIFGCNCACSNNETFYTKLVVAGTHSLSKEPWSTHMVNYTQRWWVHKYQWRSLNVQVLGLQPIKFKNDTW